MQYKELISHVDHTMLKQTATTADIDILCAEALRFGSASVCVPPSFVARALKALGGKTAVCTVIGFPLGYSTAKVKAYEAEKAVSDGADELDMVINISYAKEKRYDKITEEINTVKSAVGEKTLKVIIEARLFTDEEEAAVAAAVSASNADYIKTCTGFFGNAQMSDMEIFKKHCPNKKIKAAGGIRTVNDANAFLTGGADRIGASALIKKRRVFVIVLDSLGIGALPDAKEYNSTGADTLLSISKSPYFNIPNLQNAGIFNIDGVNCGAKVYSPLCAYGRMEEKSKGKDTIIGHWEMCGIISNHDMPTYPHGFPDEIINEFERITGRKTLCNKPYSGTEVIKKYGKEHMETGALIVYTSADSVFQVAAHESIVPIKQLYEYCAAARKLLCGKHAVGRVIARPFTGEYPFARTSNRHDYSLLPPERTLLDTLKDDGFDVISIGKISDIFGGCGITESIPTKNNADGMNVLIEKVKSDFHGLCFANLVDFDSVYGHRNDIDGYAAALSAFDSRLPEFISEMKETDTLIITADHGCDPGDESTDHTREYTPVLIYGCKPENLGTVSGFDFIGKKISERLGII